MPNSSISPMIEQTEGYILSSGEFVQHFGNGLKADKVTLLRRAYVIGEALHRGQIRDEGTPYFNHPIRVARIVFEELGIRDCSIICAALLHDVIEDSDITEQDLQSMFGDSIANTVRLLTKIKGIPTGDYLRAIEEESPDMALPIKLSDRLDNLRSVHLSKKPDKRARYLDETTTYFLPLARRHNDYVYGQMEELIAKLSQ